MMNKCFLLPCFATSSIYFQNSYPQIPFSDVRNLLSAIANLFSAIADFNSAIAEKPKVITKMISGIAFSKSAIANFISAIADFVFAIGESKKVLAKWGLVITENAKEKGVEKKCLPEFYLLS